MVTNPRGNQTLYRKDAFGRIAYVEERAGAVKQAGTAYSYDPAGELVEVLDDQCPWTYIYDRAGRLIRQVDAKGQEIDFSIDELGRVFQKHYADSTGVEQDVDFS